MRTAYEDQTPHRTSSPIWGVCIVQSSTLSKWKESRRQTAEGDPSWEMGVFLGKVNDGVLRQF